jgi:hypothetical protein
MHIYTQTGDICLLHWTLWYNILKKDSEGRDIQKDRASSILRHFLILTRSPFRYRDGCSNDSKELIDKLANLLNETAEAHHKAFAATEGEDPADYLILPFS